MTSKVPLNMTNYWYQGGGENVTTVTLGQWWSLGHFDVGYKPRKDLVYSQTLM